MTSERRARRLGAAAFVAVFAASAFARAQPRSDEPSETPVEQARRRFQDGLALARAGNCDRALTEFAASIQMAPRPNTYFNAGRCEEQLHFPTRALADYRAFLAIAGANDVHRSLVESRIAALRSEIAIVRVEANVEAAIYVDGEPVATTPASLELDPGSVAIELRSDGYESTSHALSLHAAETFSLVVTLGRIGGAEADEASGETQPSSLIAVAEPGSSPSPDVREGEEASAVDADDRHTRRRVRREFFIVGASATAGALCVGAGFGVHALRERREGQRLDPLDYEATAAARAEIRRASQIADAAFISSLGLAVATTLVGVFTDFGGRDEPARITVLPLATTAGLGLSVNGSLR